MIFKRRKKLSIATRLRDFISPRKGWRRAFRYIGKRVQRLPDTPHRIALGFACGSMASFSPFFTLHFFVAALYAWIVRGNIIAAAFGTIVGNPITFPFIAAACLKTGNWLLGRSDGVENLEALSFSYVSENPIEFLDLIFTPYLIGGLVPGLICGVACYVALRPVVGRFQKRRREVLASRARVLVGERARARSREPGSGDGGAAAAETGPEKGGSGAGATASALRAPSLRSVAEAAARRPAHRPG